MSLNTILLIVVWTVWACVNLFVFALYGLDKRRAQKGAWRTPEKTLLLGTWLLGGVGAYAGMKVFRHKTKHLIFQVSAPVGAALSVVIMAAATMGLMGWV